MTYTRAITFGSQHEEEAIAEGVPWIRQDGYVVLEAKDDEQWWKFAKVIFGLTKEPNGALRFAFDYDLAEFEAEGGQADRYYFLGRLAEFSCLPIPLGAHVIRASA